MWQSLFRLILELLARPWTVLEKKRLEKQLAHFQLPQHLGLILDGNRRYARDAGLPRIIDGHRLGAEKLRQVLRWCSEAGVKAVTIWIFSLENFQRNSTEVTELLQLIEQKIRELKDLEDLYRDKIRVRFSGRLKQLPLSLQEAIRLTEEATAAHDHFQLNVAIAYSGREEICDAVCDWLQQEENSRQPAGELAKTLTPSQISEFLYTPDLPPLDLIIRTSGEVRLSGFLLWQSPYAELYFCHRYWPQFRRLDLLRALAEYNKRKRRFGK